MVAAKCDKKNALFIQFRISYRPKKNKNKQKKTHPCYERKSYKSCFFIRSKAMLFALVSSLSLGPLRLFIYSAICMQTYMLPSPATHFSIPSPCWILTCQNILGSAVTTASPPPPVWDGACLSVSMCMWQCDKRQMSDLNRDSIERRKWASLGQVAWSGWREKESQRQQHSSTCIIDNLCFLSIEFMTFLSVIYFSWPVQKMVVGWAVSRQLGWKWQSRA